jgi:LacI family transcriptional regulator
MPEMIFAASDLQAIGVLKAAADLGISIPEEVALVGFDDIDAADYMDITTVSQHLDDTGRLAADLLLRRLDDPDRPVEQITIPLKLVARRTS